MSKKNKLMALCVTVLCSQCLHAQPRVMSIGQLLTLADQNSVSLQAWRTQEAAAEEALKAAQAQRLPDISVSATASYWGNGHLWDRNFSNGSQIRMPHFGNNFALEAQQTVYAGGAVSSSIELPGFKNKWLRSRGHATDRTSAFSCWDSISTSTSNTTS